MPVIQNCKSAQAYFAPYVDDTLPDDDAQAIQAHLRTCPDCLAKLGAARQALLIIQRLRDEHVPLPEGFEARLMMRIMAGDLAADVLDFSWQGLVATLLQLLELIFGMLLGAQPEEVAQPAM